MRNYVLYIELCENIFFFIYENTRFIRLDSKHTHTFCFYL